MIKNIMRNFFLILFICLFFNNCERNPYTKEIGMVQIYNSQIADTAFQNENSDIRIIASAPNGCWSNLFVEMKSHSSFKYTIKAYGTFSCREGGCACPDILVGMDTIIRFQPTQKGEYIFNVYTIKDSITVDTMIVN
jgi:hypothetical protein